ncbi:MAG: sn-glycerol-3-phosphate ABC transporter ATP-binding protein UgpC [Candidatus Eremiobacteraeota bacterium]|nr:sn-glycerol-3-phosphate ABC transporter ATP-binding protein UgpC [Candidatus Eremiobacteraeota bacterium]
MARVILNSVNKIFKGSRPVKKKWWEFWKTLTEPVDVHVVKDLCLEVRDGEFLVLVGPSGCGKTTTLRMIAGLEDITSGEIYIGDRLVNDVSPRDRDIAMVFQNYALYPHMNVYDNMAFGLRLRKFSKKEIEERIQETSTLLGIQNLLNRKPRELSGGQKQRVAMGRAIVRRPKVFLMDEPLSNLDAKLRVQMRAELQKLHRRLGVTTIYVTHDQTEAMTLGERLVLMREGIIQQVGTPLELYQEPANQFVAGFIGSPAMNFVTCRVRQEDEKIILVSSGFSIKLPDDKNDKLLPFINKEVVLGIRPEDLYDRMFAHDYTPENVFSAVVDVIEPMGSEIYIYLKSNKDTLIARMSPYTKAVVGQEMEVVIDLKKIHVFNPVTEENLFHSVD